MHEIILELDAIQYVKLEALAKAYGVAVETIIQIFLDTWVWLTPQHCGARIPSKIKVA